MAKSINKLSVMKIKHIKTAGFYNDGNGLYLQVTKALTKSWVFRYKINNKGKKHGLGSFPTVTLEMARDKAMQCKRLRLEGLDPIIHKQHAKDVMTFNKCAIQYIDSHKASWKNKKHETQWTRTLSMYAFPVIGDLPVSTVTTEHILKILTPMWNTKTETANRVRQRIQKILSWAKVMKFRTGENPALWQGHFDSLLPSPSKTYAVKHLKALPFEKLSSYFIELRKVNTVVSNALAFTILTAARSGEVRFAKWDEINFDKKLWLVPAERMKMGQEHRIPLSTECLVILKNMKAIQVNEFVFPGERKSKTMAENMMLKVLKNTHQVTVHGFRSTFKDWCTECTNFANILSEQALAHAVENKVEAAYRRGDQFDKRKKLMQAWCHYCLTKKHDSNVIQITA